MANETVDVEWEERPNRRRLMSVEDWLAKHPDASMWRFAWVIWWRIVVMAIGTVGLIGFMYLLMWVDNG